MNILVQAELMKCRSFRLDAGRRSEGGGGLICAIIELTKSNHLRPPPTNLWAARPGIDGKSSLNRTPNWKFGFFHEVGCGVPVLSLSLSLSLD